MTASPSKADRLLAGECVVLSDSDCDQLPPDLLARLATTPNPTRVGILDAYIGSLSSGAAHLRAVTAFLAAHSAGHPGFVREIAGVDTYVHIEKDNSPRLQIGDLYLTIRDLESKYPDPWTGNAHIGEYAFTESQLAEMRAFLGAHLR